MSKVYKIITDQVIEMLEKGVVPWRKPWGINPPMNGVSKKPYRGFNVFWLSIMQEIKGYERPIWLTFKQGKKLGVKLKKNQQSVMVSFWKSNNKKDDEKESENKRKSYGYLLYYRVFNVAQFEGLDIEKRWPKTEGHDFSPIEASQAILDNMPEDMPEIEHNGMDKACYYPESDKISLPLKNSFHSTEKYYSVAYHELAHSTGHKSRLSRDLSTNFNADKYSKEELVAEITSTFLCSISGIEDETMENSAAYIQHWIERLKNDPKLIISASGQAQKAADYIQGIKWNKEAEKEPKKELVKA